MEAPAERNEVFVSIGPILKGLIQKEGYNISEFSQIVGMSAQSLSQILSSENANWATINRIIRPLGYHFVLQKRRRKNPRIMIKQVKFRGKPLKVE